MIHDNKLVLLHSSFAYEKKLFRDSKSESREKKTLGIPLLVVKTPKSHYKFLTNISMLNKYFYAYVYT